MKQMKGLLFLAVAFATLHTALTAAQFQVIPDGNSYRILRNGRPFIHSVVSPFTWKQETPYSKASDFQELPDGTKVWNATSTDPRLNYRMEIALEKDGTELEITFSHSAPYPYVKKNFPPTLMGFNIVPEYFQNAKYDVIEKNRGAFKTQSGTFAENPLSTTQSNWRELVLDNDGDSVLFDMNPIGIGDFELTYNCGVCRGMAAVIVKKDFLTVAWPNNMYSFGGMTAGKLRIKDGTLDDYGKDHAIRAFHYNDKMKAQNLLSFGAKIAGKDYVKADGRPFDDESNHGWIQGAPAETVTTASGAYYSHQAGKDGLYRLAGLTKGLHIITFGAGNPTGTPNDFSVAVNGQEVLPRRTIEDGRFLTASLPIWVDDGVADIELKGDYIVSAISSQLLLNDKEDFQCRRGFWVTDGHEPSALFNNANYKPRALVFKPSVMESPLPVHGQETAGEYRAFHAEFPKVDFSDPKNYWLFDAKIERVGNNSASMEELEDPAAMALLLDTAVEKGKNTVMFSGLHARHAYPHSLERTMAYMKRFCDEAHKRGIKVISHHDTTLLWNTEGGFRKLAETLDGVNRSTCNQLPGYQYCLLSPTFRKQCTDYVRQLVEVGMDALQLDEVTFVTHAGACPYCREEFHKDTGWYLPVDETNACFSSYDNDIYRAFSSWKQEKITQWRAELIQELRAINPNIVFTGYGAFHLVLSPYGLWAWNSNMVKSGRNYSLMGKECQSPNAIANARMFFASQKFYNWFRYADGIPIYTWCSTQEWRTSYFAFSGCLMNAQLPMDFGGGFEDNPPGAMPFQHFEKNPDAMDRRLCREMVRLGILYSLLSVYNDQTETMPSGAFGLSQTLEEMHIPYVFLADDGMTDELLKPLDVLDIGATGCFSDEHLAAILRFVENGGTLLMNGAVATRDTLGKKREKWPFEDILGFTVSEKNHPVSQVILDGTSIATAKLNASMMSPAPEVEAPLFTLRMEKGDVLPGVVEKPYGKGRILYFPARIEEQFYAADVPAGKTSSYECPQELYSAYQTILEKLVGGASLLKTDAPAKIFMTLYREGDQVLVHLLNGLATGNKKGDYITAGFKGTPFPPLEKDITFTVPAFGENEIFAVSPDFEGRKPLEGTYHDNGTVTVTLPKELLKGYTLVRIR